LKALKQTMEVNSSVTGSRNSCKRMKRNAPPQFLVHQGKRKSHLESAESFESGTEASRSADEVFAGGTALRDEQNSDQALC